MLHFLANIIINADLQANAWLSAWRNPAVVKIFLLVTLLGEVPTIIVLGLAVSVFLWLKHKKRDLIALWLTIFSSEGVAFVAKIIFHRPRPLNAVVLETSASFPSGHATIAIAFYGFVAYLLVRDIKNKKIRALITLGSVILMLAIGFSRLYLGVHYVSDVVGGYLVGLLGLIIGIGFAEWRAGRG